MQFAIGIDWGGTNLKIGLVSKNGTCHKKIILPTATLPTRKIFFKELSLQIKKIVPAKHSILGIGIGAPGFVDYERGFIHNLPNVPGWKDVPFAQILKQTTGYSVLLDNDVNVIALGEYMFGAAQKGTNIICLTLGTGIGGGLIINKQLYRGSSSAAGEIGHYILHKNGRQCACGRRGCLESYIGNKRIVARAKKMLKRYPQSLLPGLINADFKKLTPEIIARAADLGDSLSLEIWNYVGECLGIVLAGAINLLNPDTIIIGGGVAQAGDILFKNIRKYVHQYTLSVPEKAVTIRPSQLGDKAGILGGAALVFNQKSGRKG